jgi:RHS repeat-associated protein
VNVEGVMVAQARKVMVWGARFSEILSYHRWEDHGSGQWGWTSYMVSQDEQGSVTWLHGADGSEVEAVEYDPYGRRTVFPATGGSQPRSTVGFDVSYTGHRIDHETGLIYARNRYLHTGWGRFITLDPLGAWADRGNLGNAYGYVGNAPTAASDPLGLLSIFRDGAASGGLGVDGNGALNLGPDTGTDSSGLIYNTAGGDGVGGGASNGVGSSPRRNSPQCCQETIAILGGTWFGVIGFRQPGEPMPFDGEMLRFARDGVLQTDNNLLNADLVEAGFAPAPDSVMVAIGALLLKDGIPNSFLPSSPYTDQPVEPAPDPDFLGAAKSLQWATLLGLAGSFSSSTISTGARGRCFRVGEGGGGILYGPTRTATWAKNPVPVSRWGRPGLQPGDWIMKGTANRWNYVRSGKWDPFPWNEYASFRSGETFQVPLSSITLPKSEGLSGTLKGLLLGQRQYFPK